MKRSILYNQPTHCESQKRNIAIGGRENAPWTQCWARKRQIHLGYLKTHLINKSKKWLITHIGLHSFYTHLHSQLHTHKCTHTHHKCAYNDDHKTKQTVDIILGSSARTRLMYCGNSLRFWQSVSHTASQWNRKWCFNFVRSCKYRYLEESNVVQRIMRIDSICEQEHSYVHHIMPNPVVITSCPGRNRRGMVKEGVWDKRSRGWW